MIRAAVLLCLAWLAVPGAPAQDRGERVRKFFEPKYLTGDRADRVFGLIARLNCPGPAPVVQGCTVKVTFDPVLNTAVLEGTAQGVAETEGLLRKFDVPQPKRPRHQLLLTIYIVGASTLAERSGALPPELDSVVKEMKATFLYTSFRLLDTISLTGSLRGLLPQAAVLSSEPYFYEVSYQHADIADDGQSADVRNFRFDLKIPVKGSIGTTGITTDFSIRQGQKLVLGKVKLDQGYDAAFLVITAKID